MFDWLSFVDEPDQEGDLSFLRFATPKKLKPEEPGLSFLKLIPSLPTPAPPVMPEPSPVTPDMLKLTPPEPINAVPKLTTDEEAQADQARQEAIRDVRKRNLVESFPVPFFGSVIPAKKFLKAATLGLVNFPGIPEPQGIGEKAAAGAAGFAGFLMSPMPLGKAITTGLGKVAGKVGGAIIEKATGQAAGDLIPKVVQRIGQYVLKGPTALGIAGAVSDVARPLEAPQRFTSNFVLGEIFQGAGLLQVTKNPVFNKIASQAGGRALLALAGRYPENYFSKENLTQNGGQVVFDELLNSYFLMHGMSPQALLTGNLTPQQKTIRNDAEGLIHEYNKDASIAGIETVPDTTDRAFVNLSKEHELDPNLPALTQAWQNLQGLREVNTFGYNIENKALRPRMGEMADKPISAHEVLVTYDKKTGEVIPAAVGTGVTEKPTPAILEQIKNEILHFQQEPFGKVDRQTIAAFSQDLHSLNLPVQTVETFTKQHGASMDDLTYTDWAKMMNTYEAVLSAPPAKRMETFIRVATGQPEYKWTNPDIQTLQNKEDEYLDQSRLRDWRQAAEKSTALEAGGAKGNYALTDLLTLRPIQRAGLVAESWQDIRLTAQNLQQRTGIPIYDGYQEVWKNKKQGDRVGRILEEPLAKIGQLNDTDNTALQRYYNYKYDPEHNPPVELTAKQQSAVFILDPILTQARPYVQWAEFQRWYKNCYKEGSNLQVFKEQDILNDKLIEIAKIFETSGREAAQTELSKTDIGLVKAGNYLPRAILGGDFSFLSTLEWNKAIENISESRLMSRSSATDRALEPWIYNVKNKSVVARVRSYIKEIMNNYYVHPALEKMDDILKPYGSNLDQTTPRGLTGESFKSYNTLDYLKLWARRVQGYTVKVGPINRIMQSAVIRPFFRVFAAKPWATIRNLFQPYVLSPHKKILFTHGQIFGHLPDDVQEYFRTNAIQFDAIQHDYFLADVNRGVYGWPVIKQYMALADKAGLIYALGDTWGRQRPFTAMYNAATDYAAKFRAGELDAKGLENKLGLEKLRPLERENVRKLFDAGKDKEAALAMAQWESDNSHFVYHRYEKAPFDMTAEGETWCNLVTWTRGCVQAFDNSLKRMYQGLKTGDARTITSSVTTIMGIYVAGRIANELLSHISFRHMSKFQSYGMPDMFLWEIGGVGARLLSDIVTTTSDTMKAQANGDPDARDKAVVKFTQLADNIVVRQFLPFVGQALSIWESVTGQSYIEPLSNVLKLRPPQAVDRTWYEAISHGIMAKDPNKSASVRHWVGLTREKFLARLSEEKNPVLRAYDLLQYKRYAYIFELLKRYQPIDLDDYLGQKEMEKEMKQMQDPDLLTKERIADEEKMSLELRKARLGIVK